MYILKKNNSNAPKITKSFDDDDDDDESYTSGTKIKDKTRNFDDETKYSSTDDSKYSSTHDFPVDDPLSTKIQTGKCKRHDEILKKRMTRNFKLSDFATYQSKTDDYEIEQLSSTSAKCICKPIKNRLKNQSKVCNCAPKTCTCTAGQSKKNTCQNNKELSKICRARKFKTGATDTFVPDQFKACNCTSKTDSSTVKTRKPTEKLSKKSRASKLKTGTTDNFAPDPSKAIGTEKENFATGQSKADSSKTDASKKLSKKSRNKHKLKTRISDNFASDQSKADDTETENFATDQSETDSSETDASIIKTPKATKKLSKKSRASKLKTGTTDNFAPEPSKPIGTEKENFATDQSKTDSSKTDASIIKTPKATKKLSKKSRASKLKTGTTDNFAPDPSKAIGTEKENFATGQSKTGSSTVKTRKTTEKLSKKSRASKLKTGTTDNFAPDSSKVIGTEKENFATDQSKTDSSKTDASIIKTPKATKKLSKKSRASKLKTGTTDNFAPDPSKAIGTEKENFATGQSKADSSKTDGSKKLSKKSRNKHKLKTRISDNFASDQSKADDTETENVAIDQTKTKDSKTDTSIIKARNTEELSQKGRTYFAPHQSKHIPVTSIDDNNDNELLSLPITPVDILPPVKYKYYDHPKNMKYKGSCLDGDYGTRIHAWGDSLKEAFEQCGMALCGYMVDLTLVEIHKKFYIEVEADEVLVLLYRFIEELRCLYITVPCFRCKKLEITKFKTNRNGCFIGCNCFGEEAKKDKHWYGITIEGTDFVNMKIVKDPDNNRFEICCTIHACS